MLRLFSLIDKHHHRRQTRQLKLAVQKKIITKPDGIFNSLTLIFILRSDTFGLEMLMELREAIITACE